MALIERFTTLSGSLDGGGQAEARRLWVETDVPMAALDLSTPSLYGLPELNTPLFDGSGLFLDRYDKGPHADGLGSEITGIYTTNKFGRLPVAQRPQTVGFESWSWRPQSVEVAIPFGIKRTYEVNANDATSRFDAWDIDTQTVTEQRQMFTLRVGGAFATQSEAFNAIALCAAQQNRIHTIQGKLYRYTTAYANQIGSAREWEIVHEWEYDGGTPGPPAPRIADPSRISMPPPVAGSGGMIRLPFERLLAYGAADPKTTPPVFYGFYPFIFDALGWQTLPGVGSL